MPKSALPEHLKDFDWAGTDNAGPIMQLKKKVQTWFAAGPRVSETTFPQKFFKWREIPKLLFLFRGKGVERWENTDGTVVRPEGGVSFPCPCCGLSYDIDGDAFYFSRIQPWLRWHVSLQWPLFFNCHFIYRQKDVVTPPKYQSSFGITKMFTFGIGFKRDGDKVYWLTANLGGNFE